MELINFGDTKDFAERLQQDWLNACLAADIPAVTRDTAARLMAVLYVHGGGHEEMVMNRKFTTEKMLRLPTTAAARLLHLLKRKRRKNHNKYHYGNRNDKTRPAYNDQDGQGGC